MSPKYMRLTRGLIINMEATTSLVIASIPILLFCSILLPLPSAQAQLRKGFYNNTCIDAEYQVANIVSKAYAINPNIAAQLLRMHFHDCFVNGCDASLLLDFTPSGEPVEKTSPFNKFMKPSDLIDQIKATLENRCPGVVSCADIIAFATRDALSQSGFLHYEVEAGRRDGLNSLAANVPGNIPSKTDSVENITRVFNMKGFNIEELVTLIGAHTIGQAHCPSFAYRAHNYNTTHDRDPKLDQLLYKRIEVTCKRPHSDENAVLPLDSVTDFKMDTSIYHQLLQGKGLIESDQAMAEDLRMANLMGKMTSDEEKWKKKFARAMIKLGRVDVKTGTQGEIRRHCRFVNRPSGRAW